METPLELITEDTARDLGLRPLTAPYRLPDERDMLDNVLEDMARGNIPCACVAFSCGVEVWRTSNGWRSEHPES